MKLNKLTKLITVASCIAMSSVAYSDSDTIDATAKWVATVGVTGGANIDFGSIDVASDGGQTVVLSTANVVSGTAAQTGSTTVGTATITATPGETIDIVLTVSASNSEGFDTSDFTCDYNGAGESGCDDADNYQPTSVASDVMEIGATITVDTAKELAYIIGGNTNSETVTVTVDYL